ERWPSARGTLAAKRGYRAALSQMRIVLSVLAEARSLPSRLTATEVHAPRCPEKERSFLPGAASHTSTEPSSLADRSDLPSAAKTSPRAPPRCTAQVRSSFPVDTSHTRSFASRCAEASVEPSGEKATALTSACSPRQT